MATKKSPEPVIIKPRKALGVRAQLQEGVVPAAPKAADINAHAIDDEQVTVIVPKPFPFTLDDHRIVSINAGVQEMPRAWARHWFVKAQGVTIYSK